MHPSHTYATHMHHTHASHTCITHIINTCLDVDFDAAKKARTAVAALIMEFGEAKDALIRKMPGIRLPKDAIDCDGKATGSKRAMLLSHPALRQHSLTLFKEEQALFLGTQ